MIITQPEKRPQLLTFLCILSFIGSGLGSVSNLFVYFNHELIMEILQEEAFQALEYILKCLLKSTGIILSFRDFCKSFHSMACVLCGSCAAPVFICMPSHSCSC